ncbi:MAG TPA: aspartate 1-decarboxylase [Candidatus Salinicoccus stercoripullorum]|uniref:Aspartate 1-decarboxylase n=1 Tax=Candidatus Salinicoccus stercoripullorum TaxID=2838756 RepID=A0A9D1QFP7_9STAP|nr:aspartate 1-decarboxylase [Candidatus Salinicoccus stercoripullorum]
MIRTMMNGKIHRAVVTEANLNYVGSITIDPVLMEAADILPDEKVQIVNNNNGERLETYVIEGERHSGEICLNGAAARKVQVGDVVIIISYVQLEKSELADHQPNVVIVDEENKIMASNYKEKRKTEYAAR